jgi:Flp pilus assembly protein TadG
VRSRQVGLNDSRRSADDWRVHSFGRGPLEAHVPLDSSGGVPTRARWSGRFNRGEDGQSLVEFALVVPLLLLVLVGIFKCGIVYNNYIQLTNAVDAGARQFSEERGQSSPCTAAGSAADNVAAGLATASLTLTMTETGGTGTYVYPAGTGTCPTLVAGDPSTVAGSYPCNLTIMGINFDPSCTLSASATEIVQ